MLLKDIIITAIICIALAGIFTAIIVNMIRNKKKGKNSCSCGGSCGGCAMSGMCHSQKENEK